MLWLLLALDQLYEIISLIRSASDSATAKKKLQELHGLTDVQSDAILQMQLRRLTALEADKIRLEHEDLVEKIKDLKDILTRKERVYETLFWKFVFLIQNDKSSFCLFKFCLSDLSLDGFKWQKHC